MLSCKEMTIIVNFNKSRTCRLTTSIHTLATYYYQSFISDHPLGNVFYVNQVTFLCCILATSSLSISHSLLSRFPLASSWINISRAQDEEDMEWGSFGPMVSLKTVFRTLQLITTIPSISGGSGSGFNVQQLSKGHSGLCCHSGALQVVVA